MADVLSAECLMGCCSQCTFLDCACPHHGEDDQTSAGDYEEFDDGEDFEPDDEEFGDDDD